MSQSILHIITQHDDDFDDLTMMNHPFVPRETDLDVTAKFDHVPPPQEQPPIHPFFSNQFKPTKSKSTKTNVKGYHRKNGVYVNPHSRTKPGKNASKKSKHQKFKPFSAKLVRVDPQLLMLQHKFNIEDAKKEQQKRKSNS